MAIGVLLAGQAWAEDCHLKDYGTLPIEMVGSRATTMVKINGTDTRFILDTGAFFNFMSKANAASLGLKLQPAPFGYRMGGVGGETNVQQAHVREFGILGTTLNNVDFIVGGTDVGDGLLGANLLDFADLELDLAHGKVTLFKVEHCEKTSLAYWVKDGKYNVADLEPAEMGFDRRSFLTVTINGVKVRAVLDSGAAATLLSRDAARRAGIDVKALGVKAGSSTFGVGAKPVRTWTVNIDTFSVGTETIQHSQMMVLDGNFGDKTEMLLGVDFLLAHHLFIANSKKKAYFTYNGGRVFSFASAADEEVPKPADTAADENGSNSAREHALLGQAHLSRGEAKAAVAELDQAIRLAPDQAAYYVARARAQMADKQPEAALADLDKALSLDPKNLDALQMRAEHRYATKELAGAATDAAAAAALAPAGSARARSIAALYIKLDEPAAALPLLDDWIRLHDNDAMLGSALNERCWARALSNQMLDDALKDCRKAIKRDGADAAYLDSLGLVQLRLEHYPESIKAYEQAVAQSPGSAWSRYGLGLAKIRSGQTEAGNADLAAARTLDPQIEQHASKFALAVPKP
ncbi:aspartyl protease family protein [Dyella japonica]|nr:aspartyl protease family protein [Dyella japonica]